MIRSTVMPRRGRRQKVQAVAVAAGLALAAASLRAQTSVSWNSATSGTWETASNWSDGLVPDNSNPPGSDYAVLINAQGPAYTITAGSHTVDGITLDSSSATLDLGGNLNNPFVAGTLTVNAGNLVLGTLSHTTVVSTLPDYQFATGGGDLVSISLGSNVGFAGQFSLKDGLQLNGHTITFSPPTGINGASAVEVDSNLTLQNGEVQLNGSTFLTTQYQSNYNLTLNPDVTVNVGTAGGIGSSGTGTVYNLGNIVASTMSPLNLKLTGINNSGLIDLEGSGTLSQSTVNITNLSNSGTVKLSNQTVTFTSPGVNTGTISIGNSLVYLNNASLNFLQSVQQPGAYIALEGNFDLSGQTFDPATYGGYLGSLSNGTIKSSAPITYNIPNVNLATAYLTNVTVASPLIYRPSGYSGSLQLENVTLDNSSITTNDYTYVAIEPPSGQGDSLDGTGTVNFSYYVDVREGATVGPGVTLATNGYGTVRILPSSTVLGTLRAEDGARLIVDLEGSFQGTYEADAGGALIFDTGWTGLPTNPRVGSGIFAFGGYASNATLDFTNAPGGPVDLGGATISNSTIVSPGRTIRVVEGPQLSNVTVAANMSLQNSSGLQIQNGLTLSNSTISLDGASADLQFTGAQTLGGNGQIIFNGPSGSISGGTATAPVTIEPGISISTGTGSGTISGQIINYGTLSASGTGQTLSIASLTNHGTVNATNGGILSLTSPWTTDSPITVDHAAVIVSGSSIAADLPTLAMNNATLVLEGPYDNTGATLHVNDSGRLLAVGPGAQVTGGTIDSPTGDALQVWPGNINNSTTLQNLVLNAPVSANGTFLNLTNVTIGGPISLNDTLATVYGTWSNSGSFNVSNNSILRLGGTPTQVGKITATNSEVDVNMPLSSAILNSFNISNSTIWLESTIDNTGGTLVVNSNGNQTHIGSIIQGQAKIIGGTIVAGATTPFTFNGTLDGVTLAASATQGFGEPGGLKIVDGLTLSNATFSITYEGDAQEIYGDMAQGTQSIAGNGQFVFDYLPESGPGSPNRYPFFGVSSGSMLTIGPGITFETAHSGGYLGNQGGAIVSNGTILSLPRIAQGTDTTIFLDGAITNNGTFHAAGGTISLKSTATLTNLVNGVLTGGTYVVDDQSSIDFGARTITENAADVELSGPNSHFDALAALAVNSGKFVLAGGRVFSTAGDLSNSGSMTIGDRSSLILPAGHWMNNTGVLGGTGLLQGDVASHGVIAPGASSGTLTIQGDLATGADSDLEFAIGGAGANVHYNNLDVTGNLQLAGALDLSFDSDFVASPMSIDLIQAGSFTGSFDSSELPALPDGMSWDTSNLNIGQVSITPEPSSLALIGLLGAGIFTLQRRRKLGRSSVAICCQ